MNGIFLGQWKRRLGRRMLIRDCGQTHVAGIAPTRSGKGANMVIPTLLTWPDSICVLDLKGENYQRSAGRRKQMAT
jgi:type IV secretion system protein VirD4